MTIVMTVARRRLDQHTTTKHQLAAVEGGGFVIRSEVDQVSRHDVSLPGATSALDAVRRSQRLHVARIEEHTDFACHEPTLLSTDDLLGALRTKGVDQAGLDDDPDIDYLFGDVNHLWSTRHDVTIDRRHVFGAPGSHFVVQAHDYRRPWETWPEILSFSWDSSDYAGVGAAGFGTSGIYRPRPDLVATVVHTDESLDITFDPVNARTSDSTLFTRALGSDIFPGGLHAHLVLAAFGYDADDLMPGDTLSSGLPSEQTRAALACGVFPTRRQQRPQYESGRS